MIVVLLFGPGTPPDSPTGKLEFFGLPLSAPDGLAWLVVADPMCGLSAHVRLSPPDDAGCAEVAATGRALCRDRISGRHGPFRWRLATDELPAAWADASPGQPA